MRQTERQHKLVSQHIEVALIYKAMLGLEEAKAYLQRSDVPPEVAERALGGDAVRAPARPQPSEPQPACRRKNRVHDAIVEAALKIERKLGTACARALLKDEHVPDDVTARILADGPRQVRARPLR